MLTSPIAILRLVYNQAAAHCNNSDQPGPGACSVTNGNAPQEKTNILCISL